MNNRAKIEKLIELYGNPRSFEEFKTFKEQLISDMDGMELIVKEVSEDCETTTEYDGVTITTCFYCEGNPDEHGESCIHTKAAKLLTTKEN